MSYDPNANQPSQPSSYPPPPQDYGTGGGYGSNYPAPQQATGNGLAIAGFVCALVGIFIFNIVLGPLGLIFGIIGLQRANRGARFKGLAITAIILGAIDIILFIIAIAFLSSNGFTY